MFDLSSLKDLLYIVVEKKRVVANIFGIVVSSCKVFFLILHRSAWICIKCCSCNIKWIYLLYI